MNARLVLWKTDTYVLKSCFAQTIAAIKANAFSFLEGVREKLVRKENAAHLVCVLRKYLNAPAVAVTMVVFIVTMESS
eukprot:snap_masked-scaffold_112-processed-gene-0.2-mRNA-1 protein AED:1.00 eAED:1.00 QI:0/-1/0/0/-1/1/1/0/77